MPDGTTNQSTALTARQEFDQQLEQQMQNFKVMLPAHVPVEKFKRIVVMAVMQNPDLFYADRRSFFLNAQKCAADGLLPDGREAVLLPFNTKIKKRLPDGTTQEVYVDLVTYIPMIQGVRKRMRNTGQVTSAEAQLVFQNDKFFQKFGSDPQIVHEPPPLGAPRGEPVGAYAIIRLKSGEVIQEVMDRNEIERVRSFSKAKDGPAWRNHWGEMARKTIMKRAAKSAPVSAELEELMQRDEEEPDEPGYVDLPMEAEPSRQIENGDTQPAEHVYTVTDADGVDHDYTEPKSVEKALELIFADAKARGQVALTEAAANNRETLAALRAEGHAAIVNSLAALHAKLDAELSPFGSKETAQTTTQPAADPTLPQLKTYDDGKPRWPEFAHEMIVTMREADRERLAQLWQHAEALLQKAPAMVKRDIERAHAERLQALSPEAA